MTSKILQEYTRQVRGGLDVEHGTDRLAHSALGLAGEAGEVADIIKKSQYRNGRLDRKRIREELGDVLWYLTAIADEMGVSLEDLAIANVEKLEKRHPERYDVLKVRFA